jgi:16S rRNA U516 pseudouridylate synthase RsuA-like enzyme
MCAALGYQVRTLKRTRMLDLEIKSLKQGAIYKLKKGEIMHLQEQLGLH